MAEVALRRRAAGRGRTLEIAHRIELLDQAAERFRLGGLSAELESGESRATIRSLLPLSDVVVATVQTLRGRRLEMWPRDAFGTILWDECHHAVTAGARAILDYFVGARVLGVTATPDRGDKVAIGHIFGDTPAYEYNLRQAIEDKYLCPIRALAVDMPTVDLSSVRTTQQEHGRDLSADDLAKVMRGEQQLHEMAGPIVRESGERSTIVFVPSVEIAHELARAIGAYMGNGRAEALDGGSSKDHRREVLERYQRGDTRILVNCALFTEGFDAPRTACVAIARPTKSRALYAQMVGRGTRLAPGKADCLILDLAPSNMRHALVAPVDLLLGKDLPDDELKKARAAMAGEDVLLALKKGENAAKAAEERRARDKGRIVADVAYRRIERDPFDELGIEGVTLGDEKGPRATARQVEAIAEAGFKLSTTPSKREATRILDEVSNRRRRGLCSIKQMRVLARQGLCKDLPFAEARAALDALASNGWQMTPEIAERWGSSAIDPAEDFER